MILTTPLLVVRQAHHERDGKRPRTRTLEHIGHSLLLCSGRPYGQRPSSAGRCAPPYAGDSSLRQQLDDARQELSDATALGLGGRAALAQYADAIDRLVADAVHRRAGRDAAGGGPRAGRVRPASSLPSFGRRSPRAVRRPPGRVGRGAARRISPSALGSRARGRTPGPRAEGLRRDRSGQSGVPPGAARRASDRGRSRSLRSLHDDVSPGRRSTRISSTRC